MSVLDNKTSLDEFASQRVADPRTIFNAETAIQAGATFDASQLAGKSVVITGGASGLGEQALRAFVAAGAFVTIGDLADDRGAQLQAELGAENVAFVHCDVTVWKDQVELFKTALAKSPKRTLDIVYANAGIGGGDDMMKDELDEAGDPAEPKLKVLKVNLIGMFYTAKLAMHYLPKQPEDAERDRCLVMTASLSGYLDHAGEPQYNASKWGTRGIFRSLRNTLPKQNIRIGIIAPWFVRTRILPDAAQAYLDSMNADWALAEDAASAVLHIASDKSVNGRSLAIVPRHVDPRGYVDLGGVDNVRENMMKNWIYTVGLKKD